jgi:hypothetical protein
MKAKTREGQDMTLAQKLFAVDVARQKNMDAGEREWGESWRPTPWLSSQLLGLVLGRKDHEHHCEEGRMQDFLPILLNL